LKKRKSKAAKKASAPRRSRKLAADIWPMERDFMERPERFRYVRKLIKTKGCVFCDVESAGVGFDSLCLHLGPKSMVVMNKYPYNNGHLLILPRRHVADLWDLSPEENIEIAEWIQKSLVILRDVLVCDGFNVGLNHGAVAGAGIPAHLHWHVIPRWHGDTNFFPLIGETKALPETLEQTYNNLKGRFA
jgi:ATP adenylyltransferase